MSIESLPSTLNELTVSEKLGNLLLEASNLDWQLQAACKETGTDRFYYVDMERGSARKKRDSTAMDSCRTCPVGDLCIAASVNREEAYGFWGASEAARKEAWETVAEAKDDPVLHSIPPKRLALFYLLSSAMPGHHALKKPKKRQPYAR